MLQQPNGLLIHQLRHHIRQDCAHSVKALICLANVLQAHVVEENLLHDEDGDGLTQLGAGLHDAQAERDDLGREQEVDDFGAVVLDQRADDAEGSQAEVLEGAGLGGGVEEGVEEEGDVRWIMLVLESLPPPPRSCRK